VHNLTHSDATAMVMQRLDSGHQIASIDKRKEFRTKSWGGWRGVRWFPIVKLGSGALLMICGDYIIQLLFSALRGIQCSVKTGISVCALNWKILMQSTGDDPIDIFNALPSIQQTQTRSQQDCIRRA
jgi:hypothetical protein